MIVGVEGRETSLELGNSLRELRDLNLPQTFLGSKLRRMSWGYRFPSGGALFHSLWLLSKWILTRHFLGSVGIAPGALFPRGQDPKATFAVPGQNGACAGCGVGCVALDSSRRHPRIRILALEWLAIPAYHLEVPRFATSCALSFVALDAVELRVFGAPTDLARMIF